jgi:tetratricopeptide (TPR) repeat protein
LLFQRLAYLLLLFCLAVFLSRFRLIDILAPLSGGIALIVFTYGIVQKFLIFPWILGQADWNRSPYSLAFRAKVASGRIFAIFPLPTLYAMVCGVLLLFIIHYFFKASGWRKLFWSALFLLGGYNLFLTQSFGGIIFFTAGALFYLIVSGIFKVKYLAPLLMVAALLFFLVVTLRFSEARGLQPAKLRFANWLQAGRVIAAAPLLGVGLGNYETAVPAQVYPGEPASIYAHNFFLQLAAEIGIPWLLFIVLFTMPWLKMNFRNMFQRDNAPFISICMLIFFFNLFDVGNYFFAAGIAFAVAFSQMLPSKGHARWGLLWLTVVLSAIVLVNEISADRQKAADLCYVRREYAQADSDYLQALRFNPWSYRALLGRAAVAQTKNDHAAAERIYRRVLSVHPGQAYASYMLSQGAYRRGAFLSAMAYARQAAQANRKNKEYQRWHEFIKTNFTDRLALPGN